MGQQELLIAMCSKKKESDSDHVFTSAKKRMPPKTQTFIDIEAYAMCSEFFERRESNYKRQNRGVIEITWK